MAETASKMVTLGSKMSNFTLADVRTANPVSLNSDEAQIATVVMFISNHCPYVQFILPKLVQVASIYQAKGIRFIAIASNDITRYPDDAPPRMAELAERMQFTFPYLYDESQDVARAFDAACTPDFFVLDKNNQCLYRGRFDDATPGNKHAVTGQDLTQALDAILQSEPVNPQQWPSLGCNIKWK